MTSNCKYAKPVDGVCICRLLGGTTDPDRCFGCRWRKESTT